MVITVVLTFVRGERQGERKLSAICIALPRVALQRPVATSSQVANVSRDARQKMLCS
jgi:hypothetical protein